MALKQEHPQPGASKQGADSPPLGTNYVHLGLQLDRTLVQGRAVNRVHRRALGLHDTDPVQNNLICIHDVNAPVWVVLNQQGIAICGAIQRTGKLKQRVEPRTRVV